MEALYLVMKLEARGSMSEQRYIRYESNGNRCFRAVLGKLVQEKRLEKDF